MSKITRFIKNFFKYIKYCNWGGYTNLTLTMADYSHILKDQKVIVTGGSMGIGLAVAKKFVSEGAKVLITGRNVDSLKSASSEINSPNLLFMVWDVSDTKNISDYFNKAIGLLGGLDILVNNAATLTFKPFEGVNEEFFDFHIDTNLKSVYFLCQEAVRCYKKNNGEKGGKIVNISSINSYQSSTELYYVTKAAVNKITTGLAAEYSKYNIQINGIAPGVVASGINDRDVSENAYYSSNRTHRIIVPEDIAELALFLCSGSANAIVGQTIVVDGGALL